MAQYMAQNGMIAFTFDNPEFRKHGALPLYGLRKEAYFEHCSVDAPDYSFREEPSIRFLKKCFSM